MQDLTPQTVFKELYRCLTLSNGENYGGLRCMVFHSAGLKKLGRVPFAHWKGLCAREYFYTVLILYGRKKADKE